MVNAVEPWPGYRNQVYVKKGALQLGNPLKDTLVNRVVVVFTMPQSPPGTALLDAFVNKTKGGSPVHVKHYAILAPPYIIGVKYCCSILSPVSSFTMESLQ